MDNNCIDCVHIKNIEKQIDQVNIRIDKVETDMDIQKDKSVRSEEKTLMIFDILKDIKKSVASISENMEKSISRISDKMDAIDKKPNVLLEKVAVGVITAIVMIIFSMALRHNGVM